MNHTFTEGTPQTTRKHPQLELEIVNPSRGKQWMESHSHDDPVVIDIDFKVIPGKRTIDWVVIRNGAINGMVIMAIVVFKFGIVAMKFILIAGWWIIRKSCWLLYLGLVYLGDRMMESMDGGKQPTTTPSKTRNCNCAINGDVHVHGDVHFHN